MIEHVFENSRHILNKSQKLKEKTGLKITSPLSSNRSHDVSRDISTAVNPGCKGNRSEPSFLKC